MEISKQFIARKIQAVINTISFKALFQMNMSKLAMCFHESTLLATWLEISESKCLFGKTH